MKTGRILAMYDRRIILKDTERHFLSLRASKLSAILGLYISILDICLFLMIWQSFTGRWPYSEAAAESMIEAYNRLYAVEASLHESHFRIEKCLLGCQHFKISCVGMSHQQLGLAYSFIQGLDLTLRNVNL